MGPVQRSVSYLAFRKVSIAHCQSAYRKTSLRKARKETARLILNRIAEVFVGATSDGK